LSTKSAVVFPNNNPLAPPPFPAWFPPPPPTITTTIVGWLLASFLPSPAQFLFLKLDLFLNQEIIRKQQQQKNRNVIFTKN
jgi:hypothetical protein